MALNLPGPTPTMFEILAEAMARHIDPKCAGFVKVVFSLHDREQLRALMAGAGFSNVAVDQTHTTLQLPAPQDFL